MRGHLPILHIRPPTKGLARPTSADRIPALGAGIGTDDGGGAAHLINEELEFRESSGLEWYNAHWVCDNFRPSISSGLCIVTAYDVPSLEVHHTPQHTDSTLIMHLGWQMSRIVDISVYNKTVNKIRVFVKSCRQIFRMLKSGWHLQKW